MIKDPPVRKDGKCAQPGCDQPLQTKKTRYSDPSGDPFCSAACCRDFHNVSTPTGPIGGQPRGYGKRWGRT